METRSATWVFTINNWTDCDIERLESLPYPKYFCIFGEEVAPTTGTRHLQGFIRIEARTRRACVEKVLGGHAWCAVTHNEIAAVGYSIKDGVVHCNKEIPEDTGERARVVYSVCKEMGMKKALWSCVGDLAYFQPNCWNGAEEARVCCGYDAFLEDIHWWDKNTWKTQSEEEEEPELSLEED